MGQRLTLDFKKEFCQHCKHSRKRAFLKGKDHCKSEFKPRNGKCLNYK